MQLIFPRLRGVYDRLEPVSYALLRIVAPMVVVQMLVISYLLAPTFPWIDRGYEYPLMLVFVALCISARGSGRASVDARLGREF